MGRAGNTGYMNVNYRLCGGKKANLEHISNCQEFRKVARAIKISGGKSNERRR